MHHKRSLSTQSRTILRARCVYGVLIAVLCFAWTSPTAAYQVTTNDELSGSIRVGTDTMKELMGPWIAVFSALHPTVHIELTANGALTAAPALASGTADLLPLGEFTPTELAVFHNSQSYNSTAIPLTCFVYIYVDGPPNTTLAQPVREFLRHCPLAPGRSGAGGHLHSPARADRPRAARQTWIMRRP